MSIQQSYLRPEEQNALFQMMKQRGQQPTTNMGEAAPTGAPDETAINGLSPEIQQQLQSGQKMDPQAAMQLIQQHLASQATSPANPSVNPATGPQLNFDPKNPTFTTPLPAHGILGMMGLKLPSAPISTTNYYDIYAKQNPEKAAALGNMARGPDGKPFMNDEMYKFMSTIDAATHRNDTKEDKWTGSQLKAQGYPADVVDALVKEHGNAIPQKAIDNVTKLTTETRKNTEFGTKEWDTFAKDLNANTQRNTELSKQQSRLNSSQRVYTLIDQAAGNPNALQTPELSQAVLGLIRNGNGGAVAHEAVKEMMPKSYVGTVNQFLGEVLNKPFGLEQQNMVKSLFDTMIRERGVVQDQMKDANATTIALNMDKIKSNPDAAYLKLKPLGFSKDEVNQLASGSYDFDKRRLSPKSWDEITGQPGSNPRSPLASMGSTDTPATPATPAPAATPPAKADAATRYKQLIGSGLSKAQAYSLMHTEGY